MKKRYYRIDKIDETGAQYRILLGERSNGKSYAVKERCLMDAYKKDYKFVYLRRYQHDTKTSDVSAYFADMPITSITAGNYNAIYVYHGSIFFALLDDDGKPTRKKEIGRAVYLTGLEHFKSQAFPGVHHVIFEEFVTSSMYLPDEPTKLQQMISTIARDNDVIVWMIGNTISRVCPYYTEWSLDKIPRQEQGTIDLYEYTRHDESGIAYTTKIAVENCASSGTSSKMFFGKPAEQITSGTWETHDMPHLPQPKENYTMLYELLLKDLGFSFVVQLLVNADGGQIVYVYPFTGKRHIKRVITTTFSDDPLTTTTFSSRIKAEIVMSTLLKAGKICYSDNLTGADFVQVMQNREMIQI